MAHKLSKKCKPLLGKARRLVLGDSHRTTGAWPEKAALYVADPLWREQFDGILGREDLFPADLFDRDQVRRCWRDLLAGQRECAGDVEKLVQFALLSKSQIETGRRVETIGCPELEE
jgi:hypothetical protein